MTTPSEASSHAVASDPTNRAVLRGAELRVREALRDAGWARRSDRQWEDVDSMAMDLARWIDSPRESDPTSTDWLSLCLEDMLRAMALAPGSEPSEEAAILAWMDSFSIDGFGPGVADRIAARRMARDNAG